MESGWCNLLPSEDGIALESFDKSESSKKSEYYSSPESNFHDQSLENQHFTNSTEIMVPSMTSSKASIAYSYGHGFSSGPSTSRHLRRSKSHLATTRYSSDARQSFTTNRNKRLKIDNNLIRSSSPTRSEISDLNISYCLNSSICDDSDCEIPPCNEPGCEGNEIVDCNYGEYCTAPAACSKNCFDRQNIQSISPRRQWPLSDVTIFENSKKNQISANTFSSYLGTPTSPSLTASLLSNNSTIYSPQTELPTPKEPFSPRTSYQDSSDLPNSNAKVYLTQSTGSTSCNGLDQPWDPSAQYTEDSNKSNSFQCPWLDCSRLIETCEQWNKHFHQEHIDPQMVYNYPLQTVSCPSDAAQNSLASFDSQNEFNFSLKDENRYRCPSENYQQGMEQYDQMPFHDHIDLPHATPNSGQLQCRLWACGYWFSDPNQLLSHAKQNHKIPAWSKPADDQFSPHELTHLNFLTETQDQNDSYLENEIGEKKFLSANEMYNHQLSLRIQGSESQFTEKDSLLKNTSTAGEVKLTAHQCLWKDLHGIICGTNCASEDALQNHIKETHLENLDNKTGYYCRWDGCTRESKLGPKASFTQRGKLERHMATHTNFKCSTCDICGVSFSAPQAMRQHRRLHTGERPWKCQHCSKTFTQQSACTVHERTHTNEKPLECPICLKRFSESSNLTKHRKTHGERGAHVCLFPRCGKTFHRFDQLKRHLHAHNSCSRSTAVTNQLTTQLTKKKRLDRLIVQP